MTTETNGGGLPPEQVTPRPLDETPTAVPPERPFTYPKHSRQGSIEAGRKRTALPKREHPVTITRFSSKPPPKNIRVVAPMGVATPPPDDPSEHMDVTSPDDPKTETQPPPPNTTEPTRPTPSPATRYSSKGPSFADTVKSSGRRNPVTKHRDIPTMAADRAAHVECKAPCPAWTESKRPPTVRELDILNAILAGRLPLDNPPKFLKQILSPLEIALFSDQMRQQFGFLQVPIKALARLPAEITSVSLGRLFFPMHASANHDAAKDCNAIRRDMHSCYIHPHGRKLIIQFNSKHKASLWSDRQVSFLGHATWLRHYRRPEDLPSSLDTEETQKCTAYSFRLLNVPAHIKATQIMHLLQHLEVGVTSTEVAQHMGSGELDANSYLVVTSTDTVPHTLEGKSRIVIGPTTIQLYHFQDYGNMPCLGCADLDHQAEKCPKKPLQTARVITLPTTCWGIPMNTEMTSRPTFLQWRTQVAHNFSPILTPPHKEHSEVPSTAAPIMRTAGAYDIRPDIATVTQKRHQEGTAVPATSSGHTEVAVDYQNHTRTFSQPSTSTHHECSAGSFLPTSGPLPAAPLIHPHAARSPTHTTTTMDPPTREKAADHPAPPTNGATTAAVVWAHEPPAADSYDPTTARFPQLTPNPNLPTTQAPQVAAVSTIHLGEAAIEVDIDTHGAEPDTAPSPRAEQPTPRDHSPQAPIDSPITTTLDVDMDGPEPEPGPQAAPTPPTSRILPRLQTQDTVFTNLQPSDVDMEGPLDGDTPQGVIDPDHNTPTADDLLATLQTPRASPSMMALGITRTVATARPTIDISETPAPQTARIDYAHSGTLQTLIGGRSWQEGTVAALGQCCVLALHCAKHGHGWSA
ncbi:hypothetical protein AaE_012957 [Aphanomyces astaci]|uniref:Uncharacterized protein n=1 Tax=Aphanomyces astaci TaxID=112090 RepID=A0A6A4ZNI1_APHAT|nr:hypothetical protein AaE_012957 [Aphanomyces astaci]